MKKYLSLILVIIMAASIAACGAQTENVPAAASGAASEASPQATPEASSDTAGKLPVIGVLIYKYDDTYISTVRAAITAAANGKAEIIMQDGKGDQATQNDQLDVLIEKKVDVLVVNMVDAKAAQGVVDKAKAAGIPVVFFNREPDTAVVKSYDKAIFVGTNAADAGIMQGEIMKNLWGDGSTYDLNKDGICQYVMFQGEPDNPEAIARTEYSIKKAEELGLKCEAIAPISVCNWDSAQAQTAMEAMLSSLEGKIEFVVCNNDGMAQGAVAALIAAGYNTGEPGAKMIPVIGVDATDAAKDLIAKGQMSATVKQDGEAMGNAVVSVALNAASGKEMLDGTSYKFDDTGVAIRIPYAPYTK
jgi:methyl-galactoside transport system substrate-binding protein